MRLDLGGVDSSGRDIRVGLRGSSDDRSVQRATDNISGDGDADGDGNCLPVVHSDGSVIRHRPTLTAVMSEVEGVGTVADVGENVSVGDNAAGTGTAGVIRA